MAITLVIAAPSALTSEVLSRALKQRHRQFKVMGCALNRKELLKKVAEHQPDVTLISVNLENKPTGGLQALRELRLTRYPTQAIMLLDCSEPKQVISAFSHGAKGVFCNGEGFPAMCKCIRCVHEGQVWANSGQLRWVIEALEETDTVHVVGAKGNPLLTEREEQLVRMVAEGLPNSEIRSALRLSSHTIKNHFYRIYNKLGVSNRAELILYALGSRDGAGGGDDPSKRSAS